MYIRMVCLAQLVSSIYIIVCPASLSLFLPLTLSLALASRSQDRPNFRSVTREETSNTIV